MKEYLLSTPPYYFHSLYKAFQPLGIHVFISLSTGAATASAPHPNNAISRRLNKHLNHQYSSACAEIRLLENQLLAQSQWVPGMVQVHEEFAGGGGVGEVESDLDTCSEFSSFSAISGGSSTSRASRDSSLAAYTPSRFPCEVDRMAVSAGAAPVVAEVDADSCKFKSAEVKQQQRGELQTYLRSLGLPLHDPTITDSALHARAAGSTGATAPPETPLLVPPPCHDLLFTWERLRGQLFGDKGGGLVVSGLFVAGRLNATGGSVVRGAA
jgi:hypothetical protein